MKNIKYLPVFLLAIIVILGSCKEVPYVVEPAHFHGVVQNPKDEKVVLSSKDFKHEMTLDSSGLFDDKIEIEKGYYTFSHGRESTTLYLKPGSDIHLTLDTKEFDESLNYEGTGANENNYLVSKYLAFEKIDKNTKDDYSSDEDTFSSKLNLYRTEIIQLLAEANLGSAFSTLESDNIKYEFLKRGMNYELYHQYYAGESDFKASDAYNKRFEDYNFRDETLFNTVPSYRQVVNNYFFRGEIEETMEALKSTESSVIKDEILTNLSRRLSPGTENLQAVVSDMTNLTSDTAIINNLNNQFEEMKMLVKGNISPEFEFANIKGEKVSMASLKGKNLYIDVWATWCGPCKREIPHLKTLESEYHDKNIEFVSISVDVPKDEEKWKTMVSEKELKGVQLISDNGWDTDFVRDYLIKGIPRFILVDQEGKIVSADAPRPSSGDKIKGMINSMNI